VLKDIDWLAPLEDMTRDELILEAVKRYLKHELKKRGYRITKAIWESTEQLKTGRYEP
jgi:hypothetical protein